MKTSEVRRSFGLNLLGIYCSFALLALGLITLKLLGAAVGWGMQFQNVYFLTFMIFVIAAFVPMSGGWFLSEPRILLMRFWNIKDEKAICCIF
ncbi:MAG: hypothetical protein ACLU99_05555 [Alphaproteobacteria bacterium]